MDARRRLATALLFALMTTPTLTTHAGEAAPRAVSLEALTRGQQVHGFRAEAVYLDDADAPFGGRFLHERTGFTLDYLRVQSVPQAFLYVTTFPTSDKGEPHTQEHLLLGKGNKGRSVGSLEDMSLVRSSAYTEQWRTAYHFHTGAGPDVFFRVFEARMDALLNPDYTDEEVRREVRNFGVAADPDGALRLEEKGTVYNEMVSSFERPASRLWRQVNADLYGPSHPLALSSGGYPPAIREMTPDDIRRFHREHYFLANMGLVASFPKEVSLESALARFDEALDRLEPEGFTPPAPVRTMASVPAPAAAPPGTIRVVDYPNQNAQAPGPVVFLWPAALDLADTRERTLLELFLGNLAGDTTTNLYKLFVDTKTRQMDVGARGVYAGVFDQLGNPVYMGLTDVAAASLTEEKIAAVRAKIREELARVASWKDGSPELAEFNARMASRIVGSRRSLAKFVNSPPGFGARGGASGWINLLEELERTGEFRRSVTFKPELAFAEAELAKKENVWRGYVAKWRLVDAVPVAAAARANPALIEREERERVERIASELARLKSAYGAADEQETVRRFREEYDATTARLDELAKGAPSHRFVDAPPMTLDDQLDFTVGKAAGGVPLVSSTFDNMTSATAGIAFRLDGVGRDDLVYLSLLPGLMTGVGVIENGKPVSYDEMTERLRNEILGLNASFSTSARTGRCELVVRGSGNTAAESVRAVEWMRLVAASPDWRPENLARIRDYVDQTLGGHRKVMQAPEEQWVNDPANAYMRQELPLYLATSSFLARAHNAQRLKWLLADAGTGPEREAISAFLASLGSTRATRAETAALLAAMKAPAAAAPPAAAAHAAFARLAGRARDLAVEAAKDLEQSLAEVPDESLAADWAYLCETMRRDLLVAPAEALARLERVRREVVRAGNARMFVVGSRASQARLEKPIAALVAAAGKGASRAAAPAGERVVEARLRERVRDAARPVFVGLVNPNTRGGVFLNSAPAATYERFDREALLDFLAAKLYGGGGAHGIFMKTWGAGLAYSNGVGGSPSSGRLSYYAERCPELPQTLRFVVGELERAGRDPGLVEYAVAQALGEFRSAQGYEARGEAMAADLADGVAPERVRAFRKAVLDLRSSPDLAGALYDRMLAVYGRVLPGLDGKAGTVEGGVYYVIGPEKQFELYEEYLRSAVGPEAKLYRLYPRDYWIVAR